MLQRAACRALRGGSPLGFMPDLYGFLAGPTRCLAICPACGYVPRTRLDTTGHGNACLFCWLCSGQPYGSSWRRSSSESAPSLPVCLSSLLRPSRKPPPVCPCMSALDSCSATRGLPSQASVSGSQPCPHTAWQVCNVAAHHHSALHLNLI